MTPLIWIGIILLIFFFPFLRFCVRVYLLKGKLSRFCQKKGYEILWYRDPLPAALSPQKGFDFLIKTPTHSYEVKLFSARHRFREYSFVNDSEVAVFRKISFNLIARGRGLRGMGILNSVDFGLSAKNLPMDFPEASCESAEKILLFYPISKDVTWIAAGGGKKYLGNGDLFYHDFRMLSRSAFLEELDSPGKYLRRVNAWEKY